MRLVAFFVLLLTIAAGGYAFLWSLDRHSVAEIESFLQYCDANPSFYQCTPENIARAKALLRNS